MDTKNNNYRVGYKKPPKHSRFKPGTSGNPFGRRKGSVSLRQLVKATLLEKHTVTSDGKKQKKTAIEIILLQLKKKAFQGDVKAIEKLVNFLGPSLELQDEPRGFTQAEQDFLDQVSLEAQETLTMLGPKYNRERF